MPGPGLLGGRYRLEDALVGEGGMGVVYRAIDIGVGNRKVAVKTINGAVDRQSVEQFRREWDALADLCHANIVNVYDVGEFPDKDGKKPYFVMPLLPGADLGKLLERPGSRLDTKRLVGIVSQVCKGLQSAHNRGIVHRDLKPSNIFLLDDDTVIIIDFGVAHLAGSKSEVIKGTLPYMAPEQLEGKATPQSDIYSLGVVCYEALTGRKPFIGTVPEVMDSIRSHMPPPISDVNPAVPFAVAQVIHRALAKQPYQRIASAKEFSTLLGRALDGEPLPQFDRSRIEPRVSRIQKAIKDGDGHGAMELIRELQLEGAIDSDIALLRIQVEEASRAKLVLQLLEGARLRLDEEDYSSALQKVQSALELFPAHIDALALKREIDQRSGADRVGKWYEIACQQRDSHQWTKAREAIGEVLKLNPDHEGAASLLAEVNWGEEEAARLRQEAQRLYDSARRAYGNGEINTALLHLDRLREVTARSHPSSQANAEYERFRRQVQLERDDLKTSYYEARAALDSGDFARAKDICQHVLDRRPRDTRFAILSIDIGERETQVRSAAVADWHRRIEGEADLERKLQLAKEAAGAFSEEPSLAEVLHSVKQRSEWVNTLVRRAREYEWQGELAQASEQWELLRTFYPQYPHLEYELQRLHERQQNAREEHHSAASIPERSIESPAVAIAAQSSRPAAHAFSSGAAGFGTTWVANPDDAAAQNPDSGAGSKELIGPPPPQANWNGFDAAPARNARSSARDEHYWTPQDDDRADSREGRWWSFKERGLKAHDRTLWAAIAIGLTLLLLAVVATRPHRSIGLFSRAAGSKAATVKPGAGGSSQPSLPASSAVSNDTASGKGNSATTEPPRRPVLLPVHFRSNPAPAKVSADHKSNLTCDTPCSLNLLAGEHVFVFTAPGRDSVSRIMQVPVREEIAVDLPLETSSVQLVSDPPGASIMIDGHERGSTPLVVQLTAGQHQLTAKGNGLTREQTIQVNDGEEDSLKIVTINLKSGATPPLGKT